MAGSRSDERWVSPPLVPREAPSRWRSALPFRLAALVLAVLAVLLLVLAYRVLSGATAQDPGVGAAGSVAPAVRTVAGP